MAWTEPVGNGRHYACFRDAQGNRDKVRDKRGKPIQHTSKAVAKRKAADAEDKARNPDALPKNAGKITWGEWFTTWWPEHQNTIEANTIAAYTTKIENFVKKRWESEPLDDIDRELVQKWVTALPCAPSSAHVIYSIFSASMKAAVGKHIKGTPCVNITLPRLSAPEIHFLSRAEFDAILAFLDDPWRRLALLVVGTGMRWGEAVALHWADVHAATITVRMAYSTHGKHIKPFPKSRKPRTVPLPPWLRAEMSTWSSPWESCTTLHREGRCPSGLVLPAAHGGCHVWSGCRQGLERGVRLARVGHTTWHDLRDTYASWLLQSREVTIEQIAELLGHKDIKVTRERYAEFGSSQLDHVASVLESASPTLAPVVPQLPGGNVIPFDPRRRPSAG